MENKLLKHQIDWRVFRESSKNFHQPDRCQRQRKAGDDRVDAFHLDASYRVNKLDLFVPRINTLIQLPNAHNRRRAA